MADETDHETATQHGGRPSPRPAAYHKLPIAEKRARAMGAMREQSVVCPVCETQTAPRDLLEHLASRCGGRREPHPASEWVRWGAARKLGVADGTLRLWVDGGKVRARGKHPDREYLLRDLAVLIAARTANRRRDRRILR